MDHMNHAMGPSKAAGNCTKRKADDIIDSPSKRAKSDVTSSRRSSSQHSCSSVEFVLSAPPSPPSIYPSHLSRYLVPMAPVQRARTDEKSKRLFAKRLLRREARMTTSEIVARAQRRFEREHMKEFETALREEACIKRELKRAKKTAMSLEVFQTIDIRNDCDEEDSECEQLIVSKNTGIGAKTKTANNGAFAGLITIQDRLSAMNQALSEHAKEGTVRTEPGRHSFHVDAAVSRQDELTGIAVVQKTHRQYWASLWTARGYRISETLDQTDAEAWAIWQALQITLEKAHVDRTNAEPQDPCSVAVVYSDCQEALRRIGSGDPDGGKVVQKIIAQSIELQQLGVDVHLHWVPGHRNIPGNELADLVSKKARRPVK